MKSMFLINKNYVDEVRDICKDLNIEIKSFTPEETERGILYRVVMTNLNKESAQKFIEECSKRNNSLFLKSIEN